MADKPAYNFQEIQRQNGAVLRALLTNASTVLWGTKPNEKRPRLDSEEEYTCEVQRSRYSNAESRAESPIILLPKRRANHVYTPLLVTFEYWRNAKPKLNTKCKDVGKEMFVKLETRNGSSHNKNNSISTSETFKKPQPPSDIKWNRCQQTTNSDIRNDKHSLESNRNDNSSSSNGIIRYRSHFQDDHTTGQKVSVANKPNPSSTINQNESSSDSSKKTVNIGSKDSTLDNSVSNHNGSCGSDDEIIRPHSQDDHTIGQKLIFDKNRNFGSAISQNRSSYSGKKTINVRAQDATMNNTAPMSSEGNKENSNNTAISKLVSAKGINHKKRKQESEVPRLVTHRMRLVQELYNKPVK